VKRKFIFSSQPVPESSYLQYNVQNWTQEYLRDIPSCCAPLLVEADLTTKNLLRVDTKKSEKKEGNKDLLKRVSRP
jgi:hypothetical protein